MGFEIINILKKEKGLTNAQIAKMSGITLSTLDKITSGINTNPKLDTLQAICKVLGCTLDDFSDQPKTQKASPYSSEAVKLADAYDNKLDNWGRQAVRELVETEIARCEDETQFRESPLKEEPKVIPLYTNPAAAGYAAPIFGEDFEPYELRPEDPQGAMFAVKVSGDSMEPHFPDGSIVFCNKDPMADGDIGIFSVDGGTVCKQYHQEGGVVYLFSLNRRRADADLVLFPGGNRSFVCQGRVITRRRYPVPGRG